jgi:ABC-type uncharacterized transport system permease subunit
MSLQTLLLNAVLPLMHALVVAMYVQIFTGRGKRLTRYTSLVLISLLLLHFIELTLRHYLYQTYFLGTTHDAFSFLAFSIVLVYLLIEWRTKVKASGLFILTFALFVEVFSALNFTMVPRKIVTMADPRFMVHATMAIIGYTALSLSALYAMMYLYQHRNLKFRRINLLSAQLPPLNELERMSVMSVLVGILFLGLGLFHGHLQSAHTMNQFFPLDSRVILSDVIWLFYAGGYALAKLMKWRGKMMAYLSLAGFFSLTAVTVLVVLWTHNFHQFS